MKNKNKIPAKRTLRNDLLLIGGFLLIAAAGILYLFCFRPAGNTVQITIDGKPYKTFTLENEIAEEIRTGESDCNTLIIRDGKAFMDFATCPDGICVDHPPIFREGESIVCLPNRVVVTVVTQEDDAPDIVI